MDSRIAIYERHNTHNQKQHGGIALPILTRLMMRVDGDGRRERRGHEMGIPLS